MKVQDRYKITKNKSKEINDVTKQEFAILKKIDHPNLISLIEVIDDPNNQKIYMIMNYMDLGSIGSPSHLAFIKSRYFSEEQIRDYFRQCIQGLDYRKLAIIFSSQCRKSDSL